jgi:hypothetical protein
MRDSSHRRNAKVAAWLERQPNMMTLRVGYAALVARPLTESQRVGEFLCGELNIAMTAAEDPTLCRNRLKR